jgi:hypothetical protein
VAEIARKDDVRLPLRLDMTATTSHLQQVIHDLTHHEMLIDDTPTFATAGCRRRSSRRRDTAPITS